jgi:hypothetical protein
MDLSRGLGDVYKRQEYTSVVTSVNDPHTWTEVADGGKPARDAITAIKAALEAKDEPVATLEDLEQEIYENTRQFVSLDVMEWMLKRYYTTPPQRKPLTEEEIDQGLLRTNYAMQTAGAWRDGVEWAIKQLQERNS